ncbi:hypothetical protein [Escherichia coli]|uniref:hypothetical protein n=1 Tax=Escherichia coli TaxID=562 RepID=UPI001D156EC3|nr:hypothetical protein [Escherichia coli]
MTEIIYGGIGVIALICGGLWRLHRNQLATENRLSKLESSDALLNQKFETMQNNHTQIAERVYQNGTNTTRYREESGCDGR